MRTPTSSKLFSYSNIHKKGFYNHILAIVDDVALAVIPTSPHWETQVKRSIIMRAHEPTRVNFMLKPKLENSQDEQPTHRLEFDASPFYWLAAILCVMLLFFCYKLCFHNTIDRAQALAIHPSMKESTWPSATHLDSQNFTNGNVPAAPIQLISISSPCISPVSSPTSERKISNLDP